MMNVGSSIKSSATWWFRLGLAAIIIYEIMMLINETLSLGYVIFNGVVAALVLSALARLIYGFGELIEQSIANRKNTEKMLHILENLSTQREAPVVTLVEKKPAPANTNHAPIHKWLCSHCGKDRTQTPCEHCGKE